MASSRSKKLPRQLVRQQAITVGAEYRAILHWFVDAQPDKPAVQQVVIKLLNQLSFPEDGVDDLQQ